MTSVSADRIDIQNSSSRNGDGDGETFWSLRNLDKQISAALFDTSPDPVIIIDSDMVMRSVNAAAVKQFGYEASAMIGQRSRMLYVSDEDHAKCMDVSRPALEKNASTDNVQLYMRKDGSVFAARLRVTRVVDDAGTSRGFIGVVHDISEYIELDRERRSARDMLDAALNAIPEGFAIFDSQERLVVVNEAYRQVWGSAGSLFVPGAEAESILRGAVAMGRYPQAPPGTNIAERFIAERLREFRSPVGFSQVFPFNDDQWVRIETRRTRDGNTAVLRIDVSDLKNAELALNRQRLEYLTLVQNIPDFITRISTDKRYTFVNDHYAKFIGRQASDLVGLPFLDFVPEVDRARVDRTLDNLTPRAPLVTAEQHRVLADGSDFWIFWCNMAIFDGDDLVEYITVGRDITTLKKQQERIARQTAELTAKNDALSQFTATVSHDLKAPLRHMSMFSEMIAEDIKSGTLDSVGDYAEHLRRSAGRMHRLVDSLLDYSQIAFQVNAIAAVDMSAVFADAMLNLESDIREAEARVTLEPLPSLMGDAELLKRLAQNLLSNAVKYRRPGIAPIVRVHGSCAGGQVRICVDDNGIGIDPRFASRIFDVFQRLHRDESTYSGTGIGLALSKRIVESHQGTIDIEASFVGGTRFVLTFPENLVAGKA